MVNNNNNLIIENKKAQVEEVKEINNEVPSFEEFMKSYEGPVNYSDLSGGDFGIVKGYGPCSGRDGCNCSCNKGNCSCKSKIETECFKEGNLRAGVFKSTIKGKIGQEGISLGAKQTTTFFKEKSGNREISCLSYSIGTKAELNADGFGCGVESGMEVIGYKNNNYEVRLRPNIDTGASISNDGVEIKALGVGFSVSGEQLGVSVPFGEIKVDKDDCVVQ